MIRPVQPYFALSATQYYKHQVLNGGISHIYEYSYNTRSENGVIVVPDGCIDILFDEDSDNLDAYVAGTVLSGTRIVSRFGHRYFGIRFLCGYLPSFIEGLPRDFVRQRVSLDLCSSLTARMKEGIYAAGSFQEKAEFVQSLASAGSSGLSDRDLLKMRTASEVMHLIQKSDGQIRISQIEKAVGYSSRYLNDLFNAFYGISPKKLCKITQFQSAIDQLDKSSEVSITDLAVEHGYYDQAQFIRDFKKYTSLTPGKYKKMIADSGYTDKFILS